MTVAEALRQLEALKEAGYGNAELAGRSCQAAVNRAEWKPGDIVRKMWVSDHVSLIKHLNKYAVSVYIDY